MSLPCHNQSVSVDPFRPRLENAGAHIARSRCSFRLSNRPKKRAMTSARLNVHRAPMQKQSQSSSRATPDHKVTFSVSRDSRPWWRIWNDYPNPTRDAVVGAFGIAVMVIAVWLFMAR